MRVVAFVTHLKTLFVALLLCLALPAVASAKDSDDERVVIKGPVVVDRGDSSGDIVVADGDVLIRGTVDGDVLVLNGEVTLRGTVTGDVVTLSDATVFGERGKIEGDLYYGDKKPVGAEGKVDGDIEKVNPGTLGGFGVVLALWVAVTVSVLLLGLLLLLLAPRGLDAIARAGRDSPGRSILFGLLTFILLPLLGILALVTLVGIPFGIGLLLALLPIYAIGYTSSMWILGRRILKDKPRILAFLTGLVILRLLALIPFVGGIVGLLATVFGLGAVAVAVLRARSA